SRDIAVRAAFCRHLMPALRAGVYRRRMRPALRAPVKVGNFAAAGTAPAADFDLDDTSFFLEVNLGCVRIRFLGMDRGFLERAAGTSGFPQREEGVRRRAHLPRLGLAGPAHPSA